MKLESETMMVLMMILQVVKLIMIETKIILNPQIKNNKKLSKISRDSNLMLNKIGNILNKVSHLINRAPTIMRNFYKDPII